MCVQSEAFKLRKFYLHIKSFVFIRTNEEGLWEVGVCINYFVDCADPEI